MNGEQGAIAIVTGAAGGIGRAVAERLGLDGWRVLALDKVADQVPCGGEVESITPVTLDLTDPGAIEAFFADMAAERVGVLVNNAAIQGGGAIEEQSLQDWNLFLALNATAPWLVIKHAKPLLTLDASIINIGSVAAITGFARRAAYCASKHALLGLTRALAAELAPIRVNMLALGSIDTPGLPAPSDRGANPKESYARRQLLNRLGTVSEVADAVAFLASDQSRFITGSAMVVDGGLLVKGQFG